MSRKGKSIETESKQQISGRLESGIGTRGGLAVNRQEKGSLSGEENVQKQIYGNGYIASKIY